MEHPGVTQRPPAYAQLLIDSLDRYKTAIATNVNRSTSSNWRTNFQQNILYGYFTRLGVSQIHLFWNLPTIIQGYNDTFTTVVVGTAGGTQTLTLDQGFYTPTSLAAEWQAKLQAAYPGGGFTVVYQALVGGFIISCGAGVQISFSPGPLDRVSALSRFYYTVGLTPGFTAPAGGTLVTGPPPMLPTPFIDIVSDYLTKYQRVKDSTTLQSPTVSNVIARVYPTAPNTRASVADFNENGSAPFWICIDYNTPKFIKWSPDEALTNFDLRLLDNFGEELPFSLNGFFGVEYQLTLLASES